jgi:hypothetical protein
MLPLSSLRGPQTRGNPYGGWVASALGLGFVWIASSFRSSLDASLRGPQARGNPYGRLGCSGASIGARMDCFVTSFLAMTTLGIRRALARF